MKKVKFTKTDKLLTSRKIRKLIKKLLVKDYQKRPDAKMAMFELLLLIKKEL